MIVDFSIRVDDLKMFDRAMLEERISVLVRAHRRGQNLVSMDREPGIWLLENLVLIERDRAMLQRLILDVPQSRGLLRSAKYNIRIVLPGSGVFRRNEKTIEVAIDDSSFEEIISRPVFIVEDLNSDNSIFKFIFENFPRGLFPASHCYEIVHGGGEGIIRVSSTKISERRIVVSAYDSDRPTPFSGCAKNRAFDRLASMVSWPLFFHFCLPCREIENILPIEVYASQEAVWNSDCYKFLLQLSEKEMLSRDAVQHNSFWLWFDLKEGISNEKMEKIKSLYARNWLQSKIALQDEMLERMPIPGFGPRILHEITSSSKSMSTFKDLMKSEVWLSIFQDMLLSLLWIFAASQPVRT